MKFNINRHLLSDDYYSKKLVDLLSKDKDKLRLDDAKLYYQFPLFKSHDENSSVAKILLISKYYGVIVIQPYGQEHERYDKPSFMKAFQDLEQVHSLLYSSLVKSRLIRTQLTNLRIPLTPLIYAPDVPKNFISDEESGDFPIVRTLSDIESELNEKYNANGLDPSIVLETIAIIEGTKGIIKPKDRALADVDGNKKGNILHLVETQIATFDLDQSQAAFNIINGPQRIRGLAGSGKTIVLAMKAANLHLQNPDAKIIYTFYTKSLYSLVKQLISRFYRHYAGEEPNWENLNILHGWGGPNLPGVYYTACLKHSVFPLPFSKVKSYKDPFKEACRRLNQQTIKSICDYLILDEGQDFPDEFYRLCRSPTQNNRIIWAYDECQNIFNIDIQDTKKTFGKDQNGKYYIDFSDLPPDSLQDIVLHVCYRNPRKVLLLAFAIGLGLYSEQILQLPENKEHWDDLGFQVLKGNCVPGDRMEVTRPKKTVRW